MSVQRSRSPIQPTSVGDELPESGMAGRVITGTDGPFRYLAESSRVFDPPEAVADHFFARAPTRSFPADPLTGGRDDLADLLALVRGRPRSQCPFGATCGSDNAAYGFLERFSY